MCLSLSNLSANSGASQLRQFYALPGALLPFGKYLSQHGDSQGAHVAP